MINAPAGPTLLGFDVLLIGSILAGIAATAVVFAIMVLAFSLTSFVPLAIVLLFISGSMSAIFLALNQTTLQLNTSDEVRGRVTSIYLMTWGLLPVGQLAVGAVASQIGTRYAMVVFCILGLACIGLITARFPFLRGNTVR